MWLGGRFGFSAEGGNEERSDDASGEQVKPPGRFDLADADALGQHDVERDQEDVGHGQFAHPVQHRQHFAMKKPEVHQSEADGFEIGRKKREGGDDKGQEDIAFPKALQARDNGDFGEVEERQAKPRAHQGGEPCDGEEDEESEVGEF